MMSITLMYVPVLQFLFCRFAQPNHFYIEMQLIASQRVVEVQCHVIAFDRIDARIA